MIPAPRMRTARTGRTAIVSTTAAIPGVSTDTGDLARCHYRTPLTVGVLNDAARFVFTHGQCHSLAVALAETTGCPIVVLVQRDRLTFPDWPYDDEIVHCYVEAPDGWWIDVNGEHDPVGAREAFSDSLGVGGKRELIEIRTDAAGARGLVTREGSKRLGLWVETPMLPTCLPVARALVPTVIRRFARPSPR